MDIYCDGLVEPQNPGGHACWGFVALDKEQEVTAQHGYMGYGEGMTNNVAEYTAVLKALTWAYRQEHRGCALYTDSQLVVKQVAGAWACNVPHLQALCAKVQKGLAACQATLAWVPREQNTRADALSRVAYAGVVGAKTSGEGAPPEGAPYVRAIQALDAMDGKVQEGFETDFLATQVERVDQYGAHTRFSAKQQAVIKGLVERYLSEATAAEWFYGQERLV